MPPSHRCGQLVGSPSLLEQHWWLSSHVLAQIITSTMKRRASNVTTSLSVQFSLRLCRPSLFPG